MAKKKKVVDMKYYTLMGIESNATPEEIKKAYRRKALQLHPDKCGQDPSAQEKFTIMKHAYDTLSDPQKREVYDTMGEDGVKLMEDFSSLNPEEFSNLFLKSLLMSGSKGKLVVLGIFFVTCGFLLSIPSTFYVLRSFERCNLI